jgi:poly(3-hydroxybutyrate) depolymerase
VRRFVFLVALGLALAAAGTASPSRGVLSLPGFDSTAYAGAAGGSVLAGTIPGTYAPAAPGSSYVYLPPRFTPAGRYPVVYLLHGMPGDPRIYVRAAHLARVADDLIAAGATPFIAVMPYAGPATHRGLAEWAGRWEEYLVDDVVPWTDAHLPTIRTASARVIAGLSAGGFGAVDIGLRHPGMFGTLESWSGYFQPLRDGPFAHASAADLAAHDPSLLVATEAGRLRRDGVRFELSTGVAHGGITPAMTTDFASELHTLGLRFALWHVPAGIRGPDYGDQMQHGLRYAFARQ